MSLLSLPTRPAPGARPGRSVRGGDRALRRPASFWEDIRDDTGAATAEYAIVLLAAVGFGGLMLVILRGDEVKGMLTDLVHRALTAAM